MLKNSFLGRRDEPVNAPAINSRATPDTPRYAPQSDASPLSAVAVTPPVNVALRPPLISETKTTGSNGHNVESNEPQIAGTPRLTVGPNIKLKGAEINDCDTLVVEGHVEASMDSKTLEILKTGSYEGTVTIDIAEIHGKFSGNLTARKKLVVHASGWVSGVVRYGSLLVSEGGVVCGDVASIDSKGEAQSALFAGYPSARVAGVASPATVPGKTIANGVDHHATP